MKRILMPPLFGLIAILLASSNISAHCEIPCGIYDDGLRIKQIAEHIVTIEKSMKKIISLSKESPIDQNQLVRWVSNKEEHANEIQHIASQYFMTQRIKPNADAYAAKLSTLHQILIASMKCKQTTDLTHINTLRSLLSKFEALYLGKKK